MAQLQDAKKIIDGLLDSFVDTIGDSEEFSALSKKAELFWDECLKDEKIGIQNIGAENLLLIFEAKYYRVLSDSFNAKGGFLIRAFSLQMVDNFIYLSTEYCKKKKSNFHFPKKFENILYLFSYRLLREQTLCKYVDEGLSQNVDSIRNLKSDLDAGVELLSDTEDAVKKALKQTVKKTKKKVASTERKMHERSITILGIFASIVLVFNASISFYSEAIDVFSNGSAYRIVFIFSLIGLITLSALMGLLYYLETVRNSRNNRKDKESKVFKPFIITIIVLIVIMLFTWFSGFNKESEITEEDSSSQTEITETTTLEDST